MEITQSKQPKKCTYSIGVMLSRTSTASLLCGTRMPIVKGYWKGFCMQISILVSEFGPHRVRCPACAEAMRLVGIESHPNIPDMVDLVTYECACGKVIAEPRLAELAIEAPVS